MEEITKGYPNWDVPLNKNIREYNATIGTEEMGTASTTIKGAIKELKNSIDTNKTDLSDKVQTNTADISDLKTKNTEINTQLNNIAIYSASCSYTDNVYTLTLNTTATLGDEFTVRFKAPNGYIDNSTITIGDKSYTVVNGNFTEGEIVLVNIDNVSNKAFFKKAGSGGGEIETLPSQVDTFNVVGGDAQVTLTWNNSNTNYLEGYYIVYKTEDYPSKLSEGTKIEVSKDLNSITIENLTNDTTYYFRIYPYNSKKQVQGEYKVISCIPSGGITINTLSVGSKIIDNTTKYIIVDKKDTYVTLMLEDLLLDLAINDTDGILYYSSSIDTYLNNTYLNNSLSDNLKNGIIDSTIKVNSSLNNSSLFKTITRKIFLPSKEELTEPSNKFSYFTDSSKLIAYKNEVASYWWTRSLNGFNSIKNKYLYYLVDESGNVISTFDATCEFGIRPCFNVSNIKVSQQIDENGYYKII